MDVKECFWNIHTQLLSALWVCNAQNFVNENLSAKDTHTHTHAPKQVYASTWASAWDKRQSTKCRQQDMRKWRGQTAKRLQVRAPRQVSWNCGTHEKITESDPHSRIRSCQTEKYVTQKSVWQKNKSARSLDHCSKRRYSCYDVAIMCTTSMWNSTTQIMIFKSCWAFFLSLSRLITIRN